MKIFEDRKDRMQKSSKTKKQFNIDETCKFLEESIRKKEIQKQHTSVSTPDNSHIQNLIFTCLSELFSSGVNLPDMFNSIQKFQKVIVSKAQEQLKNNSWKFLGKVALGCLAVGLFLGFNYGDIKKGRL